MFYRNIVLLDNKVYNYMILSFYQETTKIEFSYYIWPDPNNVMFVSIKDDFIFHNDITDFVKLGLCNTQVVCIL